MTFNPSIAATARSRSTDKIVSAQDAVRLIRSGDTVIIGGFLSIGFPDVLVRELAEFYESHDEGTATFGKPRDLTLISAAGMAHPTKGGGMISNEDRESQALVWLERLREATAAKQSLVEYCRLHGLRPGEAYQWKRNLRSAGRWPAKASRSTEVARTASPGFARVRIVPEQGTESAPAPLHLQLHLANGRRADLLLSDERQLPRVLALLEEPL